MLALRHNPRVFSHKKAQAEVQHEAPALQLETYLAGWDGRL